MEAAGLPLDGAERKAPPMLAPWHDVNVHAGFMGRRGGISSGAYASFNLARWIADEPDAVSENWRRWHALNPELRPALLNQVHGTKVLPVRPGDPILGGERPAADGMVTNEPNLALCIFSADCVPILLYDPGARAVGALHAGWRGTLAGIAAEGVRAIIEAGARFGRIRAALGPAIGSCCFEVEARLAEEFKRRISFAGEFIRRGKPRKAYINLRGIIRRQLEEAGLTPKLITTAGPCTRCHPTEYFSRRAAGGTITGLQMSFIALGHCSNG